MQEEEIEEYIIKIPGVVTDIFTMEFETNGGNETIIGANEKLVGDHEGFVLNIEDVETQTKKGRNFEMSMFFTTDAENALKVFDSICVVTNNILKVGSQRLYKIGDKVVCTGYKTNKTMLIANEKEPEKRKLMPGFYATSVDVQY